MKNVLFLFTLFFGSLLLAQETSLEVGFAPAPAHYESLLLSTETIKSDKMLNQHLVNLVEPMTIDSTYKRKFERHRVVGGGLIRMLGYRWLTVKNSREKVVGVVNKHYLRTGDKDKFTEYDVNYDIVPYLPEYIDLAVEAYDRQMGMRKSKKKNQIGKEPYIYPSANSNMNKYKFHCEITPPSEFRTPLNTKFYPVHSNNDLSVHPNFETIDPVIGMYGPLVLDCNHTCHPEIHPYEWIWWLDNTVDVPNSKTWWVGLMRDVSNRFKHWSSSPRTGQISIPFVFPIASNDWEIKVNHQLYNGFEVNEFQSVNSIDAKYNFKEMERIHNLNIPYRSKSIKVVSSEKIPYDGIAYDIKNISYDEELGLVTGDFVLAMSVHDIYTASVEVNYATSPEEDLKELVQLMTGTFSSLAQSEMDTDYYYITLQMHPIWPKEKGNWIYVEQALGTKQEKPYRQRIYYVEALPDGTFSSSIYLLPDAEAAVGQWSNPSFFDRWSPGDITLKDGCFVILEKKGHKQYGGSTVEKNCPSTLYGASYATSIVDVFSDRIISWDQGFDASDEQIWGAEKGGYIFIKEERK